jgi:hypothetical protein
MRAAGATEMISGWRRRPSGATRSFLTPRPSATCPRGRSGGFSSRALRCRRGRRWARTAKSGWKTSRRARPARPGTASTALTAARARRRARARAKVSRPRHCAAPKGRAQLAQHRPQDHRPITCPPPSRSCHPAAEWPGPGGRPPTAVTLAPRPPVPSPTPGFLAVASSAIDSCSPHSRTSATGSGDSWPSAWGRASGCRSCPLRPASSPQGSCSPTLGRQAMPRCWQGPRRTSTYAVGIRALQFDAVAERARQDSNLRPPAPEAGALSPELRALQGSLARF